MTSTTQENSIDTANEYEKALAAQAVVFSVTNLFQRDDEVAPRIEKAFRELFASNPRGYMDAFPFRASNGVEIACVLSPTNDELAEAFRK